MTTVGAMTLRPSSRARHLVYSIWRLSVILTPIGVLQKAMVGEGLLESAGSFSRSAVRRVGSCFNKADVWIWDLNIKLQRSPNQLDPLRRVRSPQLTLK